VLVSGFVEHLAGLARSGDAIIMPNPIDNPGYYTSIQIGARFTPGRLVDIQGLATAEEWIKNAGLTNIETLIWRKRPLIKGIKVVVGLDGPEDDDTRQAYKDWYSFIAYLKPGGNPNAKPPSYAVTNSQFKGAFVKQVVYAGHVEPIFRVNQGILGELIFDEYRKPVPLPVGPPEAAKINDTNPNPRTEQEAVFTAAVARARGRGS
jgi:hypothetical protein